MNPVVKHGSEAMRAEYLPRVAAGELHVAFGVTEPDAGTDTTAITTRARLEGDHYIVRGRKVWTTKALYCQKVLLLVRTTPLEECKRRTDGMTLLLADLQRPEVDIRPIPKVGRNAVVSCEVRYDDLPVAVTDRVGEEGDGFRYLLDGLNPERILVAAEAVGIGQRRDPKGRRLRERPRGLQPADWPEPGHRLPAGRGVRPGARRDARGVRGGRSVRRRAAVR